VAFLERWGYDAEQKAAIAAAVENIPESDSGQFHSDT
jgi:hypothetical protein